MAEPTREAPSEQEPTRDQLVGLRYCLDHRLVLGPEAREALRVLLAAYQRRAHPAAAEVTRADREAAVAHVIADSQIGNAALCDELRAWAADPSVGVNIRWEDELADTAARFAAHRHRTAHAQGAGLDAEALRAALAAIVEAWDRNAVMLCPPVAAHLCRPAHERIDATIDAARKLVRP